MGAASLEKHVLRPRANGPALAHFLVAHSHGGNVALSALKNKAVRRSIDGLVCLATPFLFSRRRQLPARLLGFSVIFVGLLIFQLTRTQLPWVYRWMLFACALVYLALMLAAPSIGFRGGATQVMTLMTSSIAWWRPALWTIALVGWRRCRNSSPS